LERHEQLARLRLEGCGEAQGFLYSQGVPVHELTDLRMPAHCPDRAIAYLEAARIKHRGTSERQAAIARAG
jgi:EAL domain-containing protein (putative c-di-GMP-specific phosphodiesterase class I)